MCSNSFMQSYNIDVSKITIKRNSKTNINKPRKRVELNRNIKCSFEGCNKVYASSHACRLHFRLKHSSGNKSNNNNVKNDNNKTTVVNNNNNNNHMNINHNI